MIMIYYDLMQDETIYDVEPLSFLMYIYLLGSTVYLYLIGHLIRTEYFTTSTSVIGGINNHSKQARPFIVFF